jgi:hypothetical protein
MVIDLRMTVILLDNVNKIHNNSRAKIELVEKTNDSRHVTSSMTSMTPHPGVGTVNGNIQYVQIRRVYLCVHQSLHRHLFAINLRIICDCLVLWVIK